MKRFIYIAYYCTRTNWRKLFKNIRLVSALKKVSKPSVFIDVLYSSFVYDLSFEDYFLLRFFNKNIKERKEYAGTGFMYEFQLHMNPKKHRKVLEDKIMFLTTFQEYSGREWATLEDLRLNSAKIKFFLNSASGKVVLKDSTGQAGKEVMILNTINVTEDDLFKIMYERKYDLIEKYVVQHEKLQELAPSGLNTLRIITQIFNGEVMIVAGRLRLSVDSDVDNLTAGNCAASIDLVTGLVTSPGVFGDFTKADAYQHPITGGNILGFKVPFWHESVSLVKRAALKIPENRSIGWDVAVTDDGPILIEGNHNWGRVLWQLPENRGLKSELLKFYEN